MLGRKKKKVAKKASEEFALPPIDFKPKADDDSQRQGILIACRSLEQYNSTLMLLGNAFKARADQIMLDYSAQGAAVRFRVDGLWEKMPPMDRTLGDGVLVVLKKLCSLNPADRKSKQTATLPTKYKGNDYIISFVSQGIPSGERVQLRIEPKKPTLARLEDLGMREKMREQLKSLLNSDEALFLFSGPPGHGLPTAWRVGLESADRFVRDFHSIEEHTADEVELINIAQHFYDKSAGETPMKVLKSLLLKQPDVLIFPDFGSPDVVSLMCEEVIEEHRYVISRIQSTSAVEGLLRLLATYKKSAKDLVKITCGVLNMRLVRRLCPDCRKAFQPSPQLLQKLGIPAGRVQQLYQPYIPPPPEQRIDANGKPLEIEICKKCNGRGYFGRVGIFELLVMDDTIRKAILQKPSPGSVTSAAREQGFLTLQEEGVLAVAQGLTSLQELQRIMAPPK